tara:strand:+ start:469 stop:981 length:513 start_codon:yes stop_codon:yes gene_type:complete
MTIIKNTQRGSILQVQYIQLDTADSQSLTANTPANINNFTVNITPLRANSIILLQSQFFGEFSSVSATANTMFYYSRNGTEMKPAAVGSRKVGVSGFIENYNSGDAGSTPESTTCTYFDSAHNTTSQIVYRLKIDCYYTGTLYINRTVSDTNQADYERGISFMSATEIAQ